MASPLLSLALTIFSLLPSTNARTIGPIGQLHITNDIVAPAGLPRSAILANGQFPGPLIVGNKGDQFLLNVVNDLTDRTMRTSTTIHWHGLLQEQTSYADGPAFVTQCPIIPGHSFEYAFEARHQAGTFWYHAHYTTQYCDGLRGPFVIYDCDDPHKHLYDVDDESTVLSLGDWYNIPATIAAANGSVPVPDATTFNGFGRSRNGTHDAPLYVKNVVYGKRYRIRLVNIACDPNYMFSIDGHMMTVIEADGLNVEPVMVEKLQIFASQRYSFVLEANQPIGNYWIRADPNLGDRGFEGGINSAILHYLGAPHAEPMTPFVNSTALLWEGDLHPLENPAAPGIPIPGAADININLAMAFDPATARFTVNDMTYQSPSVPILLQILSGTQTAQELLPNGGVYTLPSNAVVEISMPAGVAGGPHPFHLHGHTFSVVRVAGTTEYNFVNPPRRDVVSIGGAGDNVTIRFVTDNHGPWFLHCHIDWHLDMGLAIILAEDPSAMPAQQAIPEPWFDLCPMYNEYNAVMGGS
ncbi:hypothetical protein HGRIS_005381 [Hohenbuehelia grisea]|uniref:Laccase n=1 Tax=Hohenbuehelia grisea TaxID=104357 RepID=A0ABR3JFR5_9AGAR